ncbi:peptidoglycan editing factor PgeF [Granulicella paludicola]|uniref:peptidoglycan editing factor PgeF n=1 Tax=Granulicella paludicola TaxID=474951 RepID=UPI0021E09817|nr:peptidoglycan editing factor PgeF [Granulicella paludicola]
MSREMVSVVKVSGWEKYVWLQAGFSGRWGGVTAVYGAPGQLNVGWTKEDDPAAVGENRQRLVRAVAGDEDFELVTMRQVHGVGVQVVTRSGMPLATPEGKAVLESDGLITSEAGWMLGAQTADCVPVLVADTRQRAVGAFHAGWRGTVARMTEVGVAHMAAEFGSKPEDLVAAVGPSIRQCCFAVGEEVRERFSQEFSYAQELFREEEQLHVDLQEANRRQLMAAGVRDVTVVAECSACARDAQGRRAYFSHRAEQGVTGRMMSLIGVVN